MELSFSPSRMPKFNYVSGDIALQQTSIWSEAISGKSRLSNDEKKEYEKKKNEYIKELTREKTQEEIEEQKGRTVCSRCGKPGHMAFQCFNFLNKGTSENPSLNELIPSDSESDNENLKTNERSRSRSRSHHSSHHHKHKSDRSDNSSSHHSKRHHHHHHHRS